MKKLVLVFATIIASISVANAQTQQQNGVLSGKGTLQTRPADTSRSLNTTIQATPTTPQTVTPTPSTTLPGSTPIGTPPQPGNPPSPNTTNPNMPPSPSDRGIK